MRIALAQPRLREVAALLVPWPGLLAQAFRAPVAPLLISAMIADLFLGDLDIGPASSRIYLLAAALGTVAWRWSRGEIALFSSRPAGWITGLYAAFIAWSAVLALARGAPAGQVITSAGATTGFALGLFIATQALVRTKRDILAIAAALAITAVVSAVVGVFQWLGFSPAWDLASALRPDGSEKAYIRGLSLFSVPLSYHLLAGGALFLAWALWSRPASSLRADMRRQALMAIGVTALFLAMWLTLARSGIAAGSLVVIALVAIHLSTPLGRRAGRRRLLAVIGLPVLLSTLVIWVVPETHPPTVDYAGAGAYTLDRATNPSDSTRLALARYALRSWLRNPITGSPTGYLELAYPGGLAAENSLPKRPSSPHNMFLNTLVDSGLVGAGFLSLTLAAAALTGWKAVRGAWSDPLLAAIAVAAVVGLAGYVANSQFHNESLASGGTPAWWLIGLLAAIAAATSGRRRAPGPVAARQPASGNVRQAPRPPTVD